MQEQITYEDLRICNSLSREATNIKDRMRYLRALAESCNSSFDKPETHAKGSVSDRVGDGASSLADLQAQADAQIEAFLDHVWVVEQAVMLIADANEREIIRLRYVDGMIWDQISTKTHYSIDWCFELHRRGLRAMGIKQHSKKQ